jgi:hypothetical protein
MNRMDTDSRFHEHIFDCFFAREELCEGVAGEIGILRHATARGRIA